jgi:hypothetical protein
LVGEIRERVRARSSGCHLISQFKRISLIA